MDASKRQLYRLLDTASCLRTDYQSLAEFLGMESSTLEQIQMDQSSNYSITEAIINHWTTTTGNKMTFALLYSILIHPGIVGNMEAATVIHTMIEKERKEVCLFKIKLIIKSISFENVARFISYQLTSFVVDILTEGCSYILYDKNYNTYFDVKSNTLQ